MRVSAYVRACVYVDVCVYVRVRVLYVMKMIDLRPPHLCHFLIENYHSYTLLALLAMIKLSASLGTSLVQGIILLATLSPCPGVHALLIIVKKSNYSNINHQISGFIFRFL